MEIASSLYTNISKIISEFERSKPEKIAIKEGIFYTPATLAAKMASDTLSPNISVLGFNDLTKIKILDPSCGSGIFLIACFQVLIEKLKDLDRDTTYNREKILRFCIFGIDKDEEALQLAKNLLLRICYGDDVPENHVVPNLLHANTLFEAENFSDENEDDRKLLNEVKIISDEKFPRKFSLIIGNPPYGLSRGEKLSPLENEKLKEIYGKYRIGKVNKYLAFMAKGYEMLDDGGCLSYVVPNAWLGIKAGQGIRQLFIQNGTIECIESFDKPIFPALDVEAIVFRFRKTGISRFIKLIQYSDATTLKTLKSEKLLKDYCNEKSEYIIPLSWNEELAAIRKLLEKTCLPLSDFFEPLIALQAYSIGKGNPPQTEEIVKSHYFHNNEKLTSEHYPYLDGKDISRYKISWKNQFLKHGSHLAEPQKIERFQGKRILLREILNPYPYLLSAAYTDETYLYNKSVLHIIQKNETSEDDFYTLLGILNSSLAGYIIKNFGRKSQRKLFPKIVNADLRNFPLPNGIFGKSNKISELAKEMSINSTINLQNELDKAVMNSYGIEKLH